MSLGQRGMVQVRGARTPPTPPVSAVTPAVSGVSPVPPDAQPAPTALADVPPGHVTVVKLTLSPLYYNGVAYGKGDKFPLPTADADELELLGHVMKAP